MSKSRKPHTHGVWWRIVNRETRKPLSAWHYAPKLYRCEGAARRAVTDLGQFWKGCEFVVLPLPHKPGVRT